jgi:hypothetical protein
MWVSNTQNFRPISNLLKVILKNASQKLNAKNLEKICKTEKFKILIKICLTVFFKEFFPNHFNECESA